jgi:hypothetical protein
VGQKSGYILQALFTKAIFDLQINHFDPPPKISCLEWSVVIHCCLPFTACAAIILPGALSSFSSFSSAKHGKDKNKNKNKKISRNLHINKFMIPPVSAFYGRLKNMEAGA